MGGENRLSSLFGRGILPGAVLCASLIANVILTCLMLASTPQDSDPPSGARPDPSSYRVRREAREVKLASMQATRLVGNPISSRGPCFSDLPELVRDLVSLGYPPRVIRSTVARLLQDEYQLQMRTRLADEKTFQEWKRKGIAALSSSQREDAKGLARETERKARSLLADLPILDDPAAQLRWERQLGATIPWERYEELVRIEIDYADMHRAVELSPGEDPYRGSQHELLESERRKDLEALLPPAELEEYDLRFSPTAAVVRGKIGARDIAEREFREHFEAQRKLDDRMRRGGDGS